MTVTQTGRRIALVGLLAMCAALLPASAAMADHIAPQTNLDVNADLDVSDPVQASILYSQLAWTGGAATVVLATSADGGDALASGVFQDEAAFLFYNPDEGVVQAHVDEITRLGATDVIILGGEAAIPAQVQTDLENMGLNVTRYGGLSRIQTAIQIADAVGATDSLLARAFGTETDTNAAYADSAGVGLLSATNGTPALFSQTEVLTGDTEDALANYDSTTPVGGEAALSEDVISAASAVTTVNDRIAGDVRAATLIAINNELGYMSAADAAWVIAIDINQGDFFVDAFASVQLAHSLGAALIPTNGDDVSPEGMAFLEGSMFAGPTTPGLLCLIGTSTGACDGTAEGLGLDPADTVTQMLAGPVESNQGLTVMPMDEATIDVGDDRQFSATGLDDTVTYDIILAPAEDITIDADGVVHFENNNNDEYDAGAVDAFISVLNGGATTGNPAEVEVSPVDGTITFTVEATDYDSFRPILLNEDGADGENDENVELMADSGDTGTPAESEPFGVGGQTNSLPDEAPNGALTTAVVQEVLTNTSAVVDDAVNGFVIINWGGATDTYNYDTGAAGAPEVITGDNFTNYLSPGDEVSGLYSRQFASNFEIDGDILGTPGPIASVDIGDADGDDDAADVSVSWAAASPQMGLLQQYEIDLVEDDSDADEDPCTTLGALVPGTPYSNGSTEAVIDGTSGYVEDAGLAAGDYCARVRSISQTDDAADDTADADSTSAWSDAFPFSVDATQVDAPILETSTVDDDAVTIGAIDAGDIYELGFDQSMEAPGDGDFIEITDVDGDLIRILCMAVPVIDDTDALTQATCALDADDSIIIITLAEDAEDRNAAGNGTNFLYPAEITALSGLVDADEGAAADIDDAVDTTLEG